MQFDNLDDANVWIAKAVKEFKSQRRDWLRVNTYFYALGMPGYELAIKEINMLLGDRPRDHNGPYPEDGVLPGMYDGQTTRNHIRLHLNLMDGLPPPVFRPEVTYEEDGTRVVKVSGPPVPEDEREQVLAELEALFPTDMGIIPPVDKENQE